MTDIADNPPTHLIIDSIHVHFHPYSPLYPQSVCHSARRVQEVPPGQRQCRERGPHSRIRKGDRSTGYVRLLNYVKKRDGLSLARDSCLIDPST